MSSATEDGGPITCIASTPIKRDFLEENNASTKKAYRGQHISKAQFTADGTTIITQHDDSHLRTFVLPADLLDEEKYPHALTEYASYNSGTTIQDFAIFPKFDLQDPTTTFILCGSNDQPISLRSASDWNYSPAKYLLVNDKTEAHLPPRTLLFVNDGSHFLVGTHNNLAVFDVSRYNDGPISLNQLKPRKARYDGMSLTRKAHVSALATNIDNVLALGTTEREIALYDHSGQGECIAVFNTDSNSGSGMSTLKWSPCGKYLLIAERRSDCVQVYDIRDTRRLVATMTGRAGDTNQRLGMDVVETHRGCELWAGGVDGFVRMWDSPGSKEGECGPDEEFKLHDAAVTSTIWHPFASILATSSGSRPSREDLWDEEGEEKDEMETDHSLRIHTVRSSSVSYAP